VSPGARPSRERILEHLRRAARKGDAGALAVALGEMRTLAYSPRYWERYLDLLGNPLARLVDLLVVKQGERIARQKGWPRRAKPAQASGPGRRRPGSRRPGGDVRGRGGRTAAGRRRRSPPPPDQPLLFPELSR
jgi:hypothetical protein